jgi:hypothetical protein
MVICLVAKASNLWQSGKQLLSTNGRMETLPRALALHQK